MSSGTIFYIKKKNETVSLLQLRARSICPNKKNQIFIADKSDKGGDDLYKTSGAPPKVGETFNFTQGVIGFVPRYGKSIS